MSSSFLGLGVGMLVAIALIYLLLVVNFQSWLDPFIILTALTGALAGVLWGLHITSTTLSVPAMMGAMMCLGVATANSVLVVTFARTHLQEGMAPLKAAWEAGTGRLRPVLMTALAMIIGMVPMALGLGEGGEQNAPLGRAVIGGLVPAPAAETNNKPAAKLPSKRGRLIGAIIALVIVAGLVLGFLPRWRQSHSTATDTSQLAIPSVSVVSPAPGTNRAGLLLPAEVRPWLEASIFARANGYLKNWVADIGAHVAAGQLLGTIETPDLDQQLEQAKAQPVLAQANLHLPAAPANP